MKTLIRKKQPVFHVPRTKHATARLQQRSIPPIVLEWLMDYGDIQRQGGVNRACFNKKSRRLIQQYAGSAALPIFEKYANIYAVIAAADDSIITVGHRTIRFKREFIRCKK